MRPMFSIEIEGVKFHVGRPMLEAERNACYQLRYRAFCIERSRLPAKNYSDGRELDQYDGSSMLFAAWSDLNDGEVVGTFRLSRCDLGYFLENGQFNGQRFQLPEAAGGEPVMLEATAEASRLVAPSIMLPTGKRVLVSMLLFRALLIVSKQQGIRHWVYAANPKQLSNMRKDGWPFECLIPAEHEYYGELAEAGIIALGDHDFFCRYTLDE
ncbi:MAG: GNAT family N-acyltransferase [bacterium]